ncbi:MAG: hypothetical protein H0T78_02205 [Longispora sp.]|nr:hypothetical protein [Longispora sp. (in: high G+C Gram-positive bacteria)]
MDNANSYARERVYSSSEQELRTTLPVEVQNLICRLVHLEDQLSVRRKNPTRQAVVNDALEWDRTLSRVEYLTQHAIECLDMAEEQLRLAGEVKREPITISPDGQYSEREAELRRLKKLADTYTVVERQLNDAVSHDVEVSGIRLTMETQGALPANWADFKAQFTQLAETRGRFREYTQTVREMVADLNHYMWLNTQT